MEIQVNLFDPPSGKVRGVVTALVSIKCWVKVEQHQQ